MSGASGPRQLSEHVTRVLSLPVASTRWPATVRTPGTPVCHTKECSGSTALTVQTATGKCGWRRRAWLPTSNGTLGFLGLALRSIETPRWGRLFSQSQQTWPFSVALLRIGDVLYEVLPHQAGRHEAHTVAVHQLQEIPPGLIDEGHARQVNHEWSVWVARLGGEPTLFYLTDPRPGEPAFECYAQVASSVMDGNLEHCPTFSCLIGSICLAPRHSHAQGSLSCMGLTETHRSGKVHAGNVQGVCA